MVFQRDLLLFAVVLRAFFHVHRNWCGFYICIVCFVFVILLLLLLLVNVIFVSPFSFRNFDCILYRGSPDVWVCVCLVRGAERYMMNIYVQLYYILQNILSVVCRCVM